MAPAATQLAERLRIQRQRGIDIVMRVLLVSPYSLSVFGGVQGQVLGLARSLRELGVDARVVAPCDGPPPERGIVTVGPTTNFSSNGSIAPIASGKPVARRTLEARRVIDPDVIHLHEPLVPGPTQTLLLGADEPLVGTFHSSYMGRVNPWYAVFRPPLKRWVSRLTIRTAVSEQAGELAQQSFDGAYEILPNGVDVPQFAKATPWPAERPTILFVGRHEPRKGVGVLLDAFEGLERDAVLWVTGDGPETEALRGRNVPNVEWIGRVSDDEKARRLRAATVFCAPALGGESFGIVLLEAMAASAAVVASDIDGFRNVARADRDAILVDPGDAGALRGAMQRLLDDPSRRAELVASGEQRAAEFSMRQLAERFVTLYEAAIERSTVTR
jgi:phosphatidyl-myo-inositol alpha-mannosyltransferase